MEPWRNVPDMLKSRYERAALTFTASLSDASPKPAEGDAQGWLIESWNSKTGAFGATWWGLGGGHEDGFGWTKDSLAALRFAREQDAQAYINETGWTEAKPTEHRWSAPANSATGAAWKAYEEWFSDASNLLDGDTDEVDVQTWTEWYAEGMSPVSAAARYRRASPSSGEAQP